MGLSFPYAISSCITGHIWRALRILVYLSTWIIIYSWVLKYQYRLYIKFKKMVERSETFSNKKSN